MTHLSRAELLDAIEARAARPAAHAHHLEVCAACRAQADTLRSVLSRASEDQVPEPSPLFWDHFAARVSAAVHDETIADAPSRFAHLHRPFARWAMVAAAVVLAIVTVVWRATLHAPSPGGPPGAPSLAANTTPPAPVPQAIPRDNVDADEHWAVVRAAAEGLGWDDVEAAGIAAPSGATEELAMELSDAERTELARLLNQELKRNGV